MVLLLDLPLVLELLDLPPDRRRAVPIAWGSVLVF
jgi:hypothetical protein